VRYEDTIESTFCTKLHKWAIKKCITLEILKLNLHGRRGWPDRLIMWEGQHLVFIEFKRPGEEPRPLQAYVHNIIIRLGFKVLTYDNSEEALHGIKARILATTASIKSTDNVDEGEWS
jgi:hypothetical protein